MFLPHPEIAPQRPHCVAGVVGFELRNVGAKYPFESSHIFSGIRLNSGLGDYSPVSCDIADTQLGPSARISAGMLARALRHRKTLLRLHGS
jgi:hypothetical protein